MGWSIGYDSFAQGAQVGVAMAAVYTASPVGVKSALDSYSVAMCNARSTGEPVNLAQDLTISGTNT